MKAAVAAPGVRTLSLPRGVIAYGKPLPFYKLQGFVEAAAKIVVGEVARPEVVEPEAAEGLLRRLQGRRQHAPDANLRSRRGPLRPPVVHTGVVHHDARPAGDHGQVWTRAGRDLRRGQPLERRVGGSHGLDALLGPGEHHRGEGTVELADGELQDALDGAFQSVLVVEPNGHLGVLAGLLTSLVRHHPHPSYAALPSSCRNPTLDAGHRLR